MSDVAVRVGVTDPEYRCPDCGEVFNNSALTDSVIDMWGSAPRSAVVQMHDRFMHLHDVVIAPKGALSVRWAVRRWWSLTRRRVKWRVRNRWMMLRRMVRR